jgi:hypothetical protein
MQSLNWYVNRLRTMTPREVAWRVSDAARDGLDRGRFAMGLYPRPADVPAGGPPRHGAALCPVPVGAWTGVEAAPIDGWRTALLAKADDLLRHRFSFFNLTAHDLGTPIDWNRDHENNRAAPLSFAPAIDYRDLSVTGDAKIVWEPSRHLQLVVLARAYRATGNTAYAREAVAQMVSWLDQSPFGYGMNWRSPLELAIRAINWSWALTLIEDAGVCEGAVRDRIRHALYLHVWEITRKYSRGSSANNHLIGEAAGVHVVTACFPDLPNAARWRQESRAILEQEIVRQTYADGGNREQAIGYHLFVLEFFLVAGLAGRRLADDFGPVYWRTVEQMLDYVAALLEGGRLPMVGDADDGYVIDLGSAPDDPRGLLAVGGELFGRPDFARAAGGPQEWAFWVFGRVVPGGEGAVVQALRSRALADSGYYLLQAGSPAAGDAISAVIDCGELGFGALAAHGHADALSLMLRLNGDDILVDPGTYDYFSYKEWRRYYRGTPAHNTVTIDGVDQSEITGPFMWGARATARCLEFTAAERGGVFRGEHDGYARLSDPVIHRRRVELDAAARTLVIGDEIAAAGAHAAEWYFHFGEACAVERTAQGDFRIAAPHASLSLQVDPGVEAALVPPAADPAGGWVSRGYHRKTPAPVLALRARTSGSAVFTTTIRY